jgi:hypothetical protein
VHCLVIWNQAEKLYTVIQNFGFLLPKHSVLKNLPRLSIIQLKFRVEGDHISSIFFRSKQLAAWFVGHRCWLWAQKILRSSPKQARKVEQKIKILPGDQKSESNFSQIQSGINNRNFGQEFYAWFWETETSGFAKNIRNHARSYGWAETGEILEVSGEKKLLCILTNKILQLKT